MGFAKAWLAYQEALASGIAFRLKAAAGSSSSGDAISVDSIPLLISNQVAINVTTFAMMKLKITPATPHSQVAGIPIAIAITPEAAEA